MAWSNNPLSFILWLQLALNHVLPKQGKRMFPHFSVPLCLLGKIITICRLLESVKRECVYLVARSRQYLKYYRKLWKQRSWEKQKNKNNSKLYNHSKKLCALQINLIQNSLWVMSGIHLWIVCFRIKLFFNFLALHYSYFWRILIKENLINTKIIVKIKLKVPYLLSA